MIAASGMELSGGSKSAESGVLNFLQALQ